MSDVLRSVHALAGEVEAGFPGSMTEVTTFPSGAVNLDVRRGDRVLVMAYLPSHDWYGVDELSPDDGLDTSYRYGAADFAGARDALLRLLAGA